MELKQQNNNLLNKGKNSVYKIDLQKHKPEEKQTCSTRAVLYLHPLMK